MTGVKCEVAGVKFEVSCDTENKLKIDVNRKEHIPKFHLVPLGEIT